MSEYLQVKHNYFAHTQTHRHTHIYIYTYIYIYIYIYILLFFFFSFETQFISDIGRIDTAIWKHYLDANETAEVEARRKLHKNVASNIEQVLAATSHTRHQLYGHLPPITKSIQVRRTRHPGDCWRSKDELIMTDSNGPPHMAKQKQDEQLEHTYTSYVRIREVALKTCQRRWMIGRSGERVSGISVLTAWHDDDDDDGYIYIYIYTPLLGLSSLSEWSNRVTIFFCLLQGPSYMIWVLGSR